MTIARNCSSQIFNHFSETKKYLTDIDWKITGTQNSVIYTIFIENLSLNEYIYTKKKK